MIYNYSQSPLQASSIVDGLGDNHRSGTFRNDASGRIVPTAKVTSVRPEILTVFGSIPSNSSNDLSTRPHPRQFAP